MLTISDGIHIHQIYFGISGMPHAYRGPLGNIERKIFESVSGPKCQDFPNRIRDVVASVGVELLRQKLNGEPT
jgi:hypothetical protein